MPDENADTNKKASPKKATPEPSAEGAFAYAHKKHHLNLRAADSFDCDDATADMNDFKHNDGSKTGYQGVE